MRALVAASAVLAMGVMMTGTGARGSQATEGAGSLPSPGTRVRVGICTAPPTYRKLAGRLSSWENDEATLMITESDNDAATDLWNEVGLRRLQDFLDLAKMDQARLGEDGFWGLTQVTAHDELLLLELLTRPNSVLTASSRAYQLGLMARVISSQRWGTPAGAPRGVTVHVKNGWLPDGTGWHVNSIGAFTGDDRNYLIALLTDENASEQEGIDTIEAVARVVHRDLNQGRLIPRARLAASVASPAPTAWAVVPALPTPPPAPAP